MRSRNLAQVNILRSEKGEKIKNTRWYISSYFRQKTRKSTAEAKQNCKLAEKSR